MTCTEITKRQMRVLHEAASGQEASLVLQYLFPTTVSNRVPITINHAAPVRSEDDVAVPAGQMTRSLIGHTLRSSFTRAIGEVDHCSSALTMVHLAGALSGRENWSLARDLMRSGHLFDDTLVDRDVSLA